MNRIRQLEQQIAQLNTELKWEYDNNAKGQTIPLREQAFTNESPGTVGGMAGQLSQRDPIDDVFTFHDNPDAAPHYIEIREAAKTFARVIDRHAPWSEDKRSALGCVRAAVMWANAAVALNGRGL
jgi:hypothetical protein